jgi:hypothetical protein
MTGKAAYTEMVQALCKALETGDYDAVPGKLRQGCGHYVKVVDGKIVNLTEKELDEVWGK